MRKSLNPLFLRLAQDWELEALYQRWQKYCFSIGIEIPRLSRKEFGTLHLVLNMECMEGQEWKYI